MTSDGTTSAALDIVERARGMMVGIGVGNLLGIPWEGRSAAAIRRRNPQGVREITAATGYPDDDDLAQALILAEACIETDPLDIDDLARRFWRWGEVSGAGMGGLTRRALQQFGGHRPRRELRNYVRLGEPPSGEPPREPSGVPALDAARLAWEDSGRSAAGNGSVMRCGAVALRWMDDDATLARASVVSAAVTHWDPRCIWSTLLADFAIADCLRGAQPNGAALLERAGAALAAAREELEGFAVPVQPPDAVRDAVARAFAAGTDVEALELDQDGIGFAPKTLSAVLWASWRPANFEDGLCAIVNAGGDTDSTAAPAGAVLGARFGLRAIPERWRARTATIRSHEEPVDGWVTRQPLESYADRIVRLIRGGGD